jgi:hypothetical protein
MNVVWVAQEEHLVAHWCQAMASFWPGCCVKNWHLDAKSGQKLTQFQGLTAYLLLSDYFISPIYLQ